MPIRKKVETVALGALREVFGEGATRKNAMDLIEALEGEGYRIIGPRMIGLGGTGTGSGIPTKELQAAESHGEQGRREICAKYGIVEEDYHFWGSVS